MVEHRVVRTRVAIDVGLWSFGSGYLVAPGRVLTARHVLASEGTAPSLGQTCEVLLWPWDPTQGWRPGQVAWIAQGDVDAAVVGVDGVGADLPPVRWGRIEGSSPVLWTATASPVAGLDENDRRVEETAYGRVAAGSAESVGKLA